MMRSWMTWVGLLFGVIPALVAVAHGRWLQSGIAAGIAVVFLMAGAQASKPRTPRPWAGRRP